MRRGADVTVLYRRSREEMPAADDEVAEAEAEVAKGAAAAQLYKVDIEHLCGKQIQER